ncbi:MAG: dihydrolipoamide acetyltransferase family protein [bacterium]|nr:dihydrolipoamide acetyltransferase family protein [bacterium]
MANEIKMPQLSDTMNSGKILAWRKKEGEKVARGDILAEVETDKANLEIESFTQGVLLKIAIPAGSIANVGEIIAYMGEAGEVVDAVKSSPSNSIPKIQTAPISQNKSIEIMNTPSSPIQQPSLHLAHDSNERIKASPLARKIARDSNVDLNLVSGTGPAGRIVRRDIEAAVALATQPTIPSVTPIRAGLETRSAVSPRQGPSETTKVNSAGTLSPLSKMRETIARRMQESVTQAPHFYVTSVINMTEVKKLREALKETPGYEGISYNHLIIKASAFALKNEPRVNRAIKDDMLYEPAGINIGIITAIEDGLLIPVLHNADSLSLKDVIFEAKAAVDRARVGRPNSSDLTGGTFSISNMGMFDVDSFTAIINPGQGGVLAVSAIKEEPVILNGVVVPGLTMKVTLSVDHRVIDGLMAGNFLKYFKKALEIPALLMI